MKRLALLCAAAFLAVAAAVPAEEEFSEVEYYRQMAERQLAEMNSSCEEEPLNSFSVIPQYFHSRAKAGTARAPGGGTYRFGESRANGAGVTAFYNRVLTENISVGAFYQYGFLNITGSYPMDAAAPERIEERTRWHSHSVGAQAEIGLGAFGRIIPSVTQIFDFASGEQDAYTALGALGGTFAMDDESVTSTSLMLWYEKDFTFCTHWTLTPFAGWRSTFSKFKSADANVDGTRSRSHLASGGLKVGYQGERIGFNFRAGFSHRLKGDDVPGYGDRAVANGVAFFSHQANLDRTVGSFGAGVSYDITDNASLGLNYDGLFGKNTSAHMGTASITFSF